MAEVDQLRERLERTNNSLRNLTDTLLAMTTALTGTADVDAQERIFQRVGRAPSDYCRELRRTIKHLADLQQKRAWTDLATINAAYRLIGEPDAIETATM